VALLLVYCIALTKVIIVAGPTASGKSAFAKRLAQDKKGVILNGDSLQIYQGLEILTAQPSLEDQRELPHRLYGFLEPQETCSAGRWLSYSLPEIQKAHAENRVPIVVGGTGLYLKALIEGVSAIPPINPALRKKLQDQEGSQEDLYRELQAVDSVLALRINPQDRQRALRGLEVFYGTGKPLSVWQCQKPPLSPYQFEKILLMPSKEELQVCIAHRLEEMLRKGLLEEITAILARSPSSNVMKAIGLREFGAFLKGHHSFEEAKELTLIHTRQYAKRQMTWFRHQFKADQIIE
jgi:tRNA dimethylallyltransferase